MTHQYTIRAAMAVSALVDALEPLPKPRLLVNTTNDERGKRHELSVLKAAEVAAWRTAAMINLLHCIATNPDPTWWIIDKTSSTEIIEGATTPELKIMAGADFDAWPGRRSDQI